MRRAVTLADKGVTCSAHELALGRRESEEVKKRRSK